MAEVIIKLTAKIILLMSISMHSALADTDRVEAPWRLSPKRIKAQIEFIKENVSFAFRRFYGVKVLNKGELNAYNMGTHIVATTELMKNLDDRELLAVVAHEMAHRERFHQLSRAGMYIGAAVAALFVRQGEQDYVSRLAGFNEYYKLNQELQADCHAYNWLLELKHKGFDVSPLDLNKATNAVLGIDLSQVDPEFFEGDPSYIRYKAVERGHAPNC